MKNDTLVFDIETQNFFTTPDVGWNNFAALKISVVGAYSYEKNSYYCYQEHEMENLADLFEAARTIVGFSINRYDVPVLQLYFKKLKRDHLDLWEKTRIDLLDEIEAATNRRISLSRLAQANLGEGKDHHGAQAIEMYRENNIADLKAYCLKDVEITKRLFDLYRENRALFVPNKDTGEIERVEFPHPTSLQKNIFS